ncbi:MAG: hypothetical protein CVV27_03160 [Candidatus Melainabacteria bacterium HGW-Melainabacteria-1]|nr:MAG: hypothetical protein CVV27_03160 [Candidatus Melainabacteria bacterium HGW-Melainabacteria-1]
MSRLPLVLALLLLACLPATALELGHLLTQLSENYPPLLEAREKVSIARGKLLEKQGEFDTKFKGKLEGVPLGYYRQLRLEGLVEQPTPWWGSTVFSGYRLGRGDFAAYDGKKETLSGGELRTGLLVPLLRDGPIDPRRAEISALELQVSLAELEVFAKNLEAADKALKAYWAWVAASRKQALAAELLQLAETRLSQLETEIRLGKKPRIEQLENQRALLGRRNKLLESQLKLQEMRLTLGLFMPRLPPTAPDFPTLAHCLSPQLDQAQQQAQQQRPERLLLQLQQAQTQIWLALAENQLLPELDLYLQLSQDLGDGDKSRVPPELETGLSLTFPFQQSKARGQRLQLEAEGRRLALRDRFAQAEIQAQVQAATAALQTGCEQMALARAEVKVALELAAAERSRFVLGGTDLFGVNLREQAAADAQTRLAEVQENYFLAEGRFYLSLGLLPAAKP